MARAKSHKDVEFAVDNNRYYRTFKDAADAALTSAIGSGSATLDVLVYSRAGARWVGGDDAVEQYEEDPEASVFERFQISVNNAGRVP